LLLLTPSLWAQVDTLANSDSLNNNPKNDSLQIDTLSKKKGADLEGPVNYKAEKIRIIKGGDEIILSGDAEVKYQTMSLKAEKIRLDRKNNKLFAEGVIDSIGADSSEHYRGTPIFSENGEEPIEGRFIEYDFKTKRGKISNGRTEMEPGYYKGEQINKLADSTFIIQTGYFTSCDNAECPHFYFKSPKMRIIVKDKVVAKPIFFYIADVPLMAIPFGVFPNKRGRHSGLVVPTFGENQYGGKYLRNMGYYWAINDYLDALLLTDFYDKLGFTYSGRFNYALRYKMRGSFYGEYFPNDPTTGRKSQRWQFGFNHNQTIDPTFTITGSGRFVSDASFIKDTSPNSNKRLNQNITSNITARKSWSGTKNSMTLNLSHIYNLQTGRIDYTLPNLSFNRSQTSIYETITGKKSGAGKQAWYQKVYFSYNSSLKNTGSHIPDDSSDTFTDELKSGWRHNLRFSSPNKVFKYINITPSFAYMEDWITDVTNASYDSAAGKIIEEEVKGFAARHTFNFSIGAKTNLYGLFPVNIGNFKYLRHKMEPAINFNFSPDFSESYYGYFNEVSDSNDVIHKIDRFKNSAFGSTPTRSSRSMSIRLGNFFQGKSIDEEGLEKKFDLLTVNFSTNYNFLADSLNWSQLSSQFRTKIFNKNIAVTTRHSFYEAGSRGSGESAKALLAMGKLPRLISLTTSFGMTVNNKTFSDKKEKEDDKKKDPAKENEYLDNLNTGYMQQERYDYAKEVKNLSVPWSASFNINYSINKANILKTMQRIDLSLRWNLQITKNWKLSWNSRFDIENRVMTMQNINIYRDLHCWEMAFDWQPLIGYYGFKINIKSSVLQDIKLTKHPASSGYIDRY
jgi:lipopolysaccharide assembly outer membrane protein LptD (OstA)